MLAQKLNYPEKARNKVETSLQCVETVLKNNVFERELFNILRTFADLERTLGRAAQNSIDPKGLAWLGQTLAKVPYVNELVAQLNDASPGWQESNAECTAILSQLRPLSEHLNNALEHEPAQMVGKGGRIFRSGYHAELDELCDLENNFETKIAELETHERSRSGIPTLKIGYTRAFGYYFEISKGKLAQAPAHFERKQTLVNGERFITPELKELEEKALSASEKRTAIERQLLETLRLDVMTYAEPLTALSRIVAQFDVWRCFAYLAQENRWCKPELVDGQVTALEQCVHPILAGLRTTQAKFVPNDIVLGETSKIPSNRFGSAALGGGVLLVTGPNMAGKSTVMRQVALAHVLAQMGCYVPARSATLGMCDKIFTRIGSGDFALRNQSTFMVEMLETAHMLRFATPSSLLLMDEIGRGTSTFDGLSLAWAILEDLSDRVRARALFSTHYHELVDAVAQRPDVVPMRMEVVEEQSAAGEQIIFTYRFLPGAAGKSYGIHVARLAGVPENIIVRAAEILGSLSAQDRQHNPPLEAATQVKVGHTPAEHHRPPTAPSTTDNSTTPRRAQRKKQWDESVLPSLF
jgi:DNA mismatch repair protein MutS